MGWATCEEINKERERERESARANEREEDADDQTNTTTTSAAGDHHRDRYHHRRPSLHRTAPPPVVIFAFATSDATMHSQESDSFKSGGNTPLLSGKEVSKNNQEGAGIGRKCGEGQ
ncbi:hypothetical protein RHGRI_023032 [Rhododendron griersonianum]|uniref:Uncharacterized protein n=1 Tax=Rhododendron griersonianum TaxID=479676 RepID=A0AAV6J1Q7_9ERIC|nr:hypothetical protein RHGRI_023032 [Rhododendron griersonianum]